MGAALLVLAGCNRIPAALTSTSLVTFNKDIAPILFENCASCHRPARSAESAPADPKDPLCIAGAPFSLLDYDSARANAEAIARAARTRAMPPWLPEPGRGDFTDSRRLTDDEIATIVQWVQQCLQQRVSSYRWALERLVIQAPDNIAADADRLIGELAARAANPPLAAQPVIGRAVTVKG